MPKIATFHGSARASLLGGVLFSALVATQASAQTWALTHNLTVPGQAAFRATALSDNGDVGGFVVVPNGTISKLSSGSGGSGNGPLDNTWLGALLNGSRYVKVPAGDVVPVVWRGGAAVMFKRYMNSTSSWLLASAGPGKWITATSSVSGRVEAGPALAVGMPDLEWPRSSQARTWKEGGAYSAVLGAPTSGGRDLVKVNLSGAVLTVLSGRTTLVAGGTRTTVQPPAGYTGAVGVALGEDGSVLLNASGPGGSHACLRWFNGVSTPVTVQTELVAPQLSCLGISRDGVVVGMVDEALSGAPDVVGQRRRVYFTWQAGQTLSKSAPTVAPSGWGTCVGVAQGGRSAAVGGLYPEQVFTAGKVLSLRDVLTPSPSTAVALRAVSMNDAGQLLVASSSGAAETYSLHEPR